MTSTSYRLPRHVVPVDYDVTLCASPKRASFSGTLILTARVSAPTTSFELNALDLKVERVRATVGNKRIAGTARRKRDRESVELHFAKELPKGKLQVQLDFRGKLNPSMHGLYLAKDGPERAIVSQCEATDARRIFPCFDEPDLKATLKWTVVTDPGYVVLTNGLPDGKKKKRGPKPQEVHAFKRTRVIPTYLAAITVGKLEGSRAKRIAGAPCRIWCGEGKLSQTDFAAEVTARVLPWYVSYFNHKYNYQKLDQVAVPGFDAGAMENIGAIFYRQNLLLMQPGATSWHAQKRIAEVIAHEIAHQWFGNLVTMKWWDDLWLNEAFATWIAYKAIDLWQPDWRMWDEYFDSKESALAADALVSTHPIYTEVKSPAEATELFDVITYEKGCAVLRMAENYLSEGSFRDGIRRYVAAFKNGNARGADLWGKLGEASGEPVDTLMKSWITQAGFPLVTVHEEQRDGRWLLHVSQQRFFAKPGEADKEHGQSWVVPMVIQYATRSGSATHRALVSEREAVIELPDNASGAWIYPNQAAAGFYRLRLDADMLAKVLDKGLSQLSPAARASIIEDQWALVRAGLSDVQRFLEVLEAFRDERDYVVVRTLAARVDWLNERLVDEADRDAWRHFVRWLFGEQLREVGWDAEKEEHPSRAVLRATVVHALGEVGRDPAVLAEAEQRVQEEMVDPSRVEANLAGVLTALAALRGDKERLDSFVATYSKRKKERAAPELQARYLSALGYFEEANVVNRVLRLCMDGTVPQEQLRTVLTPMLSRRATQLATWKFLKQHWSEIGPRVGLMGVARLVEATGALPPRMRNDVRAFFTKHPVEEAKRALAKATEAMDLRAELIAREAPRLSTWLKQRGQDWTLDIKTDLGSA